MKNQAKHTPKPWSIAEVHGKRFVAFRPFPKGQGLVSIAELTELKDYDNARLIAAAPELLSAVKTAYNELSIRCGYKEGDAAYDELARVIAKAEGRE